MNDTTAARSGWLNLPNAITLSRLVLAIGLFVLIDAGGYWLTAAAVFVVAAATDALDGFVARRYGLVTTLGRILDPFVDKFVICGCFVFLLENRQDSGVNAWMVIIVLAREMFITSLRAFLEQQGRDFSATWSGKIKMASQCVALTAGLLSLAPQFQNDTFRLLRDVLLWGAVGITAYSGLDYCVRAGRMLSATAPEGEAAGESSAATLRTAGAAQPRGCSAREPLNVTHAADESQRVDS